MACPDRQLTQAQLEAGFGNNRTGVPKAVRPFSGEATAEALADYLNREVFPVLTQTRAKLNEVFLQVTDNAPSGNPLGYYFSDVTANADPTAGRVRLDNATQDLATTIRVSQSNARLDDVTPWLDVMRGGATSPLGTVTLFDAVNPGRFIRWDLNTMTDQGAYWDLGVSVIESSHDNPFVDGGGVVVSFIPGVSAAGSTVPIGSLSPVAGETFIGNFTPAPAAPTARDGSLVAGAGLQYTSGGTLSVGSSTSITVNANNIERAALTGFAAAVGNSNATTSAEPIVTYSASANMSAERVLTSGTNTAVDVSVANQIRVNVDDYPLTGLADQAAETFNGNFTAGSAPPTARAGSSVAGAGLTYTAGGTLAVGAGTGITVNANDVAVSATWAQVLANSNNSGAFNPHVDTGQFLGFGTEGSLPASGDIRASGSLNIFCAGLGVSGASHVFVSDTGALTSLSVQPNAVTISTFLVFDEQASSTVTPTAGTGMFWVRADAPNTAMFTDDANADWAVGYACVNVITTNPTATNATTNLSCGSYTIPANTAREGTLYRLHGQYVFVHTAAATPTLTFEVLINGSVVETVVLTPVASAATYTGWFTATIRFLTVGAGGTAMVTWVQNNDYESGVDGYTSSPTTGTDAVNTTLSRSIELRMRMTTAVASNTLTVTQGYIERLA